MKVSPAGPLRDSSQSSEHLPPSMHWHHFFSANVRAFCCFIHPLDQEQAPHRMGLV